MDMADEPSPEHFVGMVEDYSLSRSYGIFGFEEGDESLVCFLWLNDAWGFPVAIPDSCE